MNIKRLDQTIYLYFTLRHFCEWHIKALGQKHRAAGLPLKESVDHFYILLKVISY